jgi:hypothetical protein
MSDDWAMKKADKICSAWRSGDVLLRPVIAAALRQERERCARLIEPVSSHIAKEIREPQEDG